MEAFRDLIRHGNTLLGDVVAYCRDAEAAVAQLANEKAQMDACRLELQQARDRAVADAANARAAMEQVDAQRSQLLGMRDELVRARAEIDDFQRAQGTNAAALEQRLREAKEQQVRLEEELQRVKSQAAAARTVDARIASLDEMESKLRVAERELNETRRALETERSRRDRAIALIKPKQPAGGSHS